MIVKDYLIYIRDCHKYRQLCDVINEKFGYKRQYAFGETYGSVTESYSQEEYQKLFKSKHYFQEAKSILFCMGIQEHQQNGVDYLIAHQKEYMDIYSFVDDEVAAELYKKYPKMLEAKDKWDWGSDLKYYYEEGFDAENPRERKIDCDIVELECNDCFDDFEIISSLEDLEGKVVQCPHCGQELEVEIKYEPVFTTSSVR